jgi:hypothetical protein
VRIGNSLAIARRIAKQKVWDKTSKRGTIMVNKAIDALVFVLIASLTSSQLAFAQTTADQKATTQKTPTTETGFGTVTSTYEPGEIIVVGSDGPQETFSLVLDKGLPYVNKAGKLLNRHLIKRGTPIDLYYHNKGQTRVVYRVVVDQD